MFLPGCKVESVQAAALLHVVGFADALHDVALRPFDVIGVAADDGRQRCVEDLMELSFEVKGKLEKCCTHRAMSNSPDVNF